MRQLQFLSDQQLAGVIKRPRTEISDGLIRQWFADGKTDHEMAAAAGEAGYTRVDSGYIFKRRRELRLLRPKGAKPGKRKAAVGSEKRHQAFAIEGRAVSLPPLDNAALSESRTLYPSTVVPVEGLTNLLVSGINSRKIGGQITKGPAKGFPIFTLTLQERATCPGSCRHWRSCYGNSMHMAKRVRHGRALETRLEAELAVLQSRHPRGFAVRLHVLGDFYSVEYVQLWAGFLKKFRSLFVFGFTARWQREDPIAIELVQLVMAEWGRFCIRFSNAPVDECSTVSIEHPMQKPPGAIICPAQLGLTDSCSTCALCWHTKKPIAFLQH